MIITQAAKEKLDSLLSDGEYLEIGLSGGGCAGLTVGLSKTHSKPTPELSIPESGKLRWGCKTSKIYLTGGALDWVDDVLHAGFDIKLPLGTESCGCGASIKLD